MRRLSRQLAALALLVLAASSNAQPLPAWVPIEARTSGTAIPRASDVDGSGRIVVLQRAPRSASTVRELAWWDGTAWTTLPARLPNYPFHVAVTEVGAAVYVTAPSPGIASGSNSISMNYIGRYDIATGDWDDLGGGLNDDVFTLDTDGAGNLIASGRFTAATDGTSLDGIARWNHAARAWEPLGGGLENSVDPNDPVEAQLAVEPNGTVVVVGDFDRAYDAPGGTPITVNGAARYSFVANRWEPLGSGFDATGRFANGVVSDGTTVTVIGGLAVGGVRQLAYRWDGTDWTPFGALGDISEFTRDIALDGQGTVYIVGNSPNAANASAIYARAAGAAAWTLLAETGTGGGGGFPTGPGSFIHTISANPNRAGVPDLFAGGNYRGIDTSTGAVGAIHFARWNGTAWTDYQPPIRGVNGTVYAAAEVLTPEMSKRIAVGGDITEVAGTVVNKVAVFDGQTWQGLGQGVTTPTGVVRAILNRQYDRAMRPFYVNRQERPETPFVIGGTFDEVTDENGLATPASNVAEWDWDARQWRGLGQGVSVGGVPGTGAVHALAYYVGCGVSTSSPDPAYIYVGGEFDTATNADGSTVAVSNLARYRIATERWEGVEGGVGGGAVYALDVQPYRSLPFTGTGELKGHSLYVGGEFTTVFDEGGSSRFTQYLAWLGQDSEWRGGRQGPNGPVYALDAVTVSPVSTGRWLGSGLGRLSTPCGRTSRVDLFVGGRFSSVSSGGPRLDVSNLAHAQIFTGEDDTVVTWSALGLPNVGGTPRNGVNDVVRSIRMVDELSSEWNDPDGQVLTLAVGGDFTEAYDGVGPPTPARGLVELAITDPTSSGRTVSFSDLGNGTDGTVESIAWTACPAAGGASTGAHYVGGSFATVGAALPAAGLAKWRQELPAPRVSAVAVSSSAGHGGCTSGCGVGARSYALYTPDSLTPTCPPGVLARTASRANDPVELGPFTFGEVLALSDAAFAPDAPIAVALLGDDRQLVGTDTVVVDRAGPVAFVTLGVDDPDAFAPNPGGASTALAVEAVQLPFRDRGEDEAWVRLLHAVTDAPAVDLVTGDGAVLADSLAFRQLDAGVAVPLGASTVEVRRDDDGTLLATLALDVAEEEPVQLVVLAGFLDPAANQDGPPLQLVQVPMSAAAPVADELGVTDADIELGPPAPNPTRGLTRISFRAPDGPVRLDVFDALGRHVATLHDGVLPAGDHEAIWDAAGFPSGVYLVRLRAGDVQRTRRVMHLR